MNYLLLIGVLQVGRLSNLLLVVREVNNDESLLILSVIVLINLDHYTDILLSLYYYHCTAHITSELN